METQLEDLQIVVVESPADTWEHPLVPDLFRDMIGFKLRGYGREYPYGVLAVDGSDLISSHLLLCRKEKASGSLRPIMGMRWTSHVKCRAHFMKFPGLSLFEQAGVSEHVDALKEVLRAADSRGIEVFYAGSFTIEPSERRDKAHSIFFREILTLMFVNYQMDHPGSELMAGGTIRFKMDKYIERLGYEPFQWNGRKLGPIQVRHLAGEAVHVMHLRKFSFEARQTAAKWEQLWQERLWIRNENAVNLNAGAAKRAG